MGAHMIRYEEVIEKHDRIAVVGTGMSLHGVKLDFAPNVAVIAVNCAIEHLEKVDYWFTLNPSAVNNNLMLERNRRAGVKYYAAVPDNHRPVSKHVTFIERRVGTGHGRFRTKGGLCPDKHAINTGNSAWGAFQLGIHMQPSRVALFGIDAHGGYHYGGSPKALDMLPELFASSVEELARRNIQVLNGSPISLIDCFNKATPQEAVAWLNEESN